MDNKRKSLSATSLSPVCLAAVSLAMFFLVQCSAKPGAKWCIDGDLGRFSLRSMSALPGDKVGCQASYSDASGVLAQVRVSTYRAGMFETMFKDAGPPKKFEKQTLFTQRSESGKLILSWYTDKMTVRLTMTGLQEPSGPVLRGYLHRYPSLVVDKVHAVEKDIQLLRKSSRQRPADASIHLSLARNYRKLGNTIMAAGEYHISVEKDAHCYQCYFEMGTLYRQLRHWDLSISALRKATSIDPHQSQAWLVLGDVAFDVQNRLEAIRGYENAIKSGLSGKEQQRAKSRLEQLHNGKFMIQVLPGVSSQPKRKNLPD